MWDPGSPPSPAHPAPVHLVQLCAQGISYSSPPCHLQYITLNTENWQSEKPVRWEKKCKESKQWFNTQDKSRTIFIISIFNTYFSRTTNFWKGKRSERVFISISSIHTFAEFHWFDRKILLLQNIHLVQKGKSDLPQQCFCKKYSVLFNKHLSQWWNKRTLPSKSSDMRFGLVFNDVLKAVC